MSADGQGTKCHRHIAENFNRLSRVHERYSQTDRRQIDGRATANSEREREFTFPKNYKISQLFLPIFVGNEALRQKKLLARRDRRKVAINYY